MVRSATSKATRLDEDAEEDGKTDQVQTGCCDAQNL